ncbi:MAG: DUF4422 domain-containing protein [Selenomonadaceae bacterium]|nr:DUF4422 domain-containing protein [Selenomonadaceae bacterium]
MYIPRILLCGDLKKFLAATQGRTIDILGQISFNGAAERGEFRIFKWISDLDKLPFNEADFHIFLDGKEISCNALKKIMDTAADYIVFETDEEITCRFNELYQLGLFDRFITQETLMKYAADNFYSLKNNSNLINLLCEQKISRLLDFDNFLAKNDFFYDEFNIEAEAVDKNYFAKKFPVVENIYKKIYSSLDECRFKNYDALLLTKERTPAEFIDILIDTDALSEKIFAFVRKNSALESFLADNERAFEKISRFPAVNGNWIFIKKFVRADFKIYVVTHKEVKLPTLPNGYEIIHAGHAQAKKDFGYLGDDSGDNISNLNLYLNEITALYWIWKNTSHEIIGLCHYRRFFTTDGKNILTEAKAREILRGYDVIVVKGKFFPLTQHSLKSAVCGDELNNFVEKIFREHISRKQPDYLDAFDYVSSSYAEFMYEMFITRRKIFNSYCEWLFSFIVDVTKEVLTKTNIAEINNSRKKRVVGLISERLMTVWLIKNCLKIKTLTIIFRNNI